MSSEPSKSPSAETEGTNNATASVDNATEKKKFSGGHGPAYYYDNRRRGPSYYGAPYYGNGAYGTTLPYYSSNNQSAADDQKEGNSILGPLSVSRVIRVVFQKWPTLVVAVLLGLGAGFAYFKASPVVYKSTAVIEMSVRAAQYIRNEDVEINSPDKTGSIEEIFNTRLAMLRGPQVIKLVADGIRNEFPGLKTMSEDALYNMIASSVDFTLQRRSHLVLISVRHTDPKIAQSIADTYAKTAVSYSILQTQEAAESAVAWLVEQRDRYLSEKEKALTAVRKFQADNDIARNTGDNESLNLTHHQLMTELASAELAQARAEELLSILTTIQKNPDKISSLPENVPRAGEITAAQHAIREAVTKRDALLTKYTEKHPDVEQLNNTIIVLREQFAETVKLSRDTAAANLELLKKQTEALRTKEKENVRLRSELGFRISEAETTLADLQHNCDLANENYGNIVRRIENVRLSAEDTHASVRIVDNATNPQRPVSPDPRIAFSAGPILGLIIGFIFVLVLDRIEDKITSSEDIERHMGAKVLALLPHVPRITRNQLVTLSSDKKFSRFAEAFAGLRGLLESPRFADMSKVVLLVSTQPEEGKTITSSNLAVSYGMAGRKTLLVDFDLRRPRVGRMFGKADQLDEHNSLLDVLDKGDVSKFTDLPVQSGYDNLDIICSKATSHISPANVIGSDMLPKFIEWARKNYEHIVIDSPPFGLVSDALALGTLSDSVIIVCRPERSRYGMVMHALRSLAESGSRVIGVVVNDVDFGRSSTFGSYSYSNYHYGYGNGYSYGGKYGYGGRYGRYGYSSSYYRRDVNDKSVSQDSSDKEDGESSKASSVLDVDDDE